MGKTPAAPFSCSNGITADWEAPLQGTVSLGRPGADADREVYVTTRDRLHVHWRGFLDIEQQAVDASGSRPHPVGVFRYVLQLGSGPGLGDALAATDVGEADHYTASGLALRNGGTYFATVTATDFAGLSAVAWSNPVVVDATAPTSAAGGSIMVEQAGRSVLGVTLRVSWSGVADAESGLAGCAWAVGNAPLHSDIMPFTDVGHRMDGEAIVDMLDGRRFHVTVRCTNFAGLFTDITSLQQVASVNAPLPGVVADGADPAVDADYQTSRTVLAAHWTPFRHEVGVVTYSFSVGTAPGAADVLNWGNTVTGLDRTAMAEGLHLQDGVEYYVTVRGCTAAGHCSEASSDGVTVDNSPPTPGYVLDGGHTLDLDVQPSRQGVAASWAGFADHESGIAGYSWCVGTRQGACDLLPWYPVGLATKVVDPALAIPEGENAQVFVSVRCFNHMDLYSDAFSDGVGFDGTPPTMVAAPTLSVTHHLGGETGERDTQVAASVLTGTWNFTDTSGRALRYYYTVDAHHDGSAIFIAKQGFEDGFVAADLPLDDGDTYYLTVTACDEANLCTAARTSRGVLVDSSPPVGGFFVDDCAWETQAVTLEWDGFFGQ